MDRYQSKHIFAEVRIHASVEQVWRVITDYDNLADFVPNLVVSEQIPSNVTGRIRLHQIGCSQSVFWRLEAEAVLECVEVHKAMGAKELRFKAIEGDFQVTIAYLAAQNCPPAPLFAASNFSCHLACKLHNTVSLFVIPNTTHLHCSRVQHIPEQATMFSATCLSMLHPKLYCPVHPDCMLKSAQSARPLCTQKHQSAY